MKIAITPGEPAGIGVDICIMLAQTYFPTLYERDIYPVIIADPNLLAERARSINKELYIHDSLELFTQYAGQASHLLVTPVSLDAKCIAGELDPSNAGYVLQCLDLAIAGCLNRDFAAMVTGPAHKANIVNSGINFTGHTEYLQQAAGIEKVVMAFYCKQILLALATTHLPLFQVSEHITKNNIAQCINIVNKGAQILFAKDNPRISVCGLNPHAGENGYLGTEEQEIINPVIKELQQQGLNLTGSIPADTAFLPQNLEKTDVIVAMYHDQGLTALKHMAFDSAVNITLGLPFIRTSVDHGTALDLAGTANVMTSNMRCAVDLAVKLAT